ncbi:MAG TPA: NAD(P)/FAD-dependent oxidoreductase [Candidatus Binataceae bacterium]|nr:NAD(P)/FAD-dependent oxidoreductase [Candidatus Binataceae bacterium]
MMKTYDLMIIGSGTAAQVAGARVRSAGWSVAVIDHLPFGGTCALRGCDPKKILISGAEAIDAASRMRGHGVAGEPRIDWRELMAFKRSFTDPIPHKQEQHYAEKGIDAFHGLARFTGPDAVAVEGQELKARYIFIATGAHPVPLRIPGEDHVITSDRFLELDALPAHMVLVGGGYIAAEFSQLAARADVRVTVLQRGERMLSAFDPDLVGWLMEKFRELGIDVRTRSTVQRIEKTADGYLVHASTDGQAQTVAADLVVHAAGREPHLAALDLAAAGVAVEKGRLKLNEFLQSVSNPKVYAAGDAASSGPPLTPVSSHDAKTVAENLLDGNQHKPDYRGVPSVAFTIPPIAAVGLGEAEARSKGLKFRLNSEQVPDWYTARRLNESVYGFKTLVEEGTDRILGAHLVGPHAEEVINLFGLAIRHGLTTKDLKTTMFAYPTGASDIGHML